MKHEIKYHTNGNKQYEIYYNDLGQYHNESGPAIIRYYESGNKYYESYLINNQWHNTKGPAFIQYNKNCEIESKEYYLNNKEVVILSNKEFQKYIKRLNIS